MYVSASAAPPSASRLNGFLIKAIPHPFCDAHSRGHEFKCIAGEDPGVTTGGDDYRYGYKITMSFSATARSEVITFKKERPLSLSRPWSTTSSSSVAVPP